GEIKIGGLVAAFEDVEAQEIFLGRERIPSADDFE
ncbi:MAG: archaeal transcriptional regulator TrmB, partial [Haloquadratum sp. J07HQX50]